MKHDWPSDSVKATTDSHIACCDVAFRMDRLRRPLRLCKISKLYSITTLLPNCLRLALPVTSQNPRLANGGSLRLAMRVFHPLNYPPFISGRTYPFTAPLTSPLTICFCKDINRITMGRINKTPYAIIIFHLVPYSVRNW